MSSTLKRENIECDVLVAIMLKIVENKDRRDLNPIFSNFYCLKNVFVEMYHLLIHIFT
jgi:hypothetical protein